MPSVKPSMPQNGDAPKLLGLDAAELATRRSLFTAQEISQQPGIWREAQTNIESNREEIDAWLLPKLMLPQVQVYFCGAGTSEFVGDTIAAWLRSSYESDKPVIFESVATTDLVVDPMQYFANDRPTIMISFARSGDSPESVAAAELADQIFSDCYHLIFTCNPDGQLAEYAKKNADILCLTMPKNTNDRGFAMTSSYSSMLVSCAAVFKSDAKQLEQTAQLAESIIRDQVSSIANLAAGSFDRLVVLGSGLLKGTAREGALKCLELAGGELVAISDTPLGFRHGPKIVVTSSTLVILLVSTNPYTRQYDEDALAELKSDGQACDIIELSPKTLFSGTEIELDDVWLSMVYIVYCQILAFLKSYSLGVTVDSPCPSGEVNRIVQGVTIHPFEGLKD